MRIKKIPLLLFRISGNVPQVFRRTNGFKDDRCITAIEESGIFALRITQAKLSDTGVYYCVKPSQQQLIFLKGTHLKVEGKYIKASIVIYIKFPDLNI